MCRKLDFNIIFYRLDRSITEIKSEKHNPKAAVDCFRGTAADNKEPGPDEEHTETSNKCDVPEFSDVEFRRKSLTRIKQKTRKLD